MYFLGLLVGMAALYLGAEWLVRGSARLAYALGIRPVIIGVTVVGFATSMPEVVVSGMAAYEGHTDTALGNVIGSSVANPGLILGLAAAIVPIGCDPGLLKREGPFLGGVTAVIWGLAWTGVYTRWQGALMLAGLAVFIYLSLLWSRGHEPPLEKDLVRLEQGRVLRFGPRANQVILIAVGLALVVIGAQVLITSAVTLARRWGISEIVIAATLVAVGTSLPELATSVVAAARKQMEISVGNIVGSNIFNLLGVLGISAVIRPLPVSIEVRDFQLLWLLGFTAVTAVFLRTGYRLSRLEGALLLAGYATFIVLLFALPQLTPAAPPS